MAKQQIKESKFVNPFEQGVDYDVFLKAVGSKSVSEYCKGKLTDSEIEWLKEDLKLIKIKK
tara:strand:- start:202 stop:384 length:183 start_codon:yes stop_codon:yes gene_type:complete